jgi:hypothetical protein
MQDEFTKQAAEEFLAAKLAKEKLEEESRLNLVEAMKRSPKIWKSFRDSVEQKCKEWNTIAGAQVLTCRETILGDLRVWCPERSLQLTIHYDSKLLQIHLKNSARLEPERESAIYIKGFATGDGRDARLERNDQPINLDQILASELRILTGVVRRAGT